MEISFIEDVLMQAMNAVQKAIGNDSQPAKLPLVRVKVS